MNRLIGALTLVLVFLLFSSARLNDNLFEISKGLKLFSNILSELNSEYVDDFDPELIIEAGINSMVESLDPYTTYYPEEELDGYRMQTTGKYGGIGAMIRTIDDYVIIAEPYENFPAQKTGLKAGDKILSIDGKSAKGMNTEQVSQLLKGNPGTKVKVDIERFGMGNPMTKTLTREEISIKSVPFSTKLPGDIGYIKLNSFTADCNKEVRAAINECTADGQKLKGLILDLRGNPGGLLQEAIDVSGLFLEKGKRVVSTRGKVRDWDKYFSTRVTPVDVDLPLVVLLSRGSASASEIVGGVMQDHDRGVIIGEKSFGKGLVQSTRDLKYNAKVKLTTAKYYLPSGRCVQAVDYSGRYQDGAESISDTVRTAFSTTNKRVVYDSGGVDPDIEVKNNFISDILATLMSEQYVFNFASDYSNRHDNIGEVENFALADQDFEDFVSFVSDDKYDYISYTEKLVANIEANAEKDNFDQFLTEDVDRLQSLIQHDMETELRNNKDEVKQILTEEIVSRYYFRRGRLQASLKDDRAIAEAVAVLSNPVSYQKLLSTKN